MASGGARAADVRLNATGDCAERSEIVEQVDGLLGRSVGSVAGFDFDVDITQGPDRRWRLRLVTTDHADGAKRSREIDGAGCAQLADAAAVAIAMSIQSSAAPEPDAAAARAPAPPETSAAVTPPPVDEPRPLHLSLGIGALGELGALPHPGFGIGLGVSLDWRRLLLIAEGSLFTSPEARLPDNSGGSFRLVVGAVLACFAQPIGQTGILACAGGEAGIVQAEGVGINRPRLRNVGWQAGRLEVGISRRLAASVSLFVRAGVAVPWSRPIFRINDTVDVHRSDALAARVTLGALFEIF